MNALNLNAALWKKLFLALSILAIIIMPMLSKDYGQNGDEDVEIVYGQDIYKYWTEGNQQALHYDAAVHPQGNNITGLEFYGGFFDLLTEFVHQKTGAHIVLVRHFFSALCGALLFIFTGLLTYRLSNKNWLLAVISFLFILFSPRLFGESMNNGKDIPFAMAIVMGCYYLIRLLQDAQQAKGLWLETFMLCLSWFLLIGFRGAGALLFIGYLAMFILAYLFFNKEQRALWHDKKIRFKLLLRIALAIVIGYVLGILTWPFVLQSPIGNFLHALEEMTNRTINIRVIFEGAYYYSTAMPWYYEPKWIIITSPVMVLLGIILFLVFVRSTAKQFGWFSVFVVLFGALFPLLYIIYKNSTVYDSWRHVFFVYPFWAIAGAMGVFICSQKCKPKLRWIPLAASLVLLMPAIAWTFRSHPNQYIYFNELAGGLKGANGKYDLDYYHNSGKQMADWIIKNAKKNADGQPIKVLTNMDGMDYYFRNDTTWIYSRYARYNERSQKDWDYYITFTRFLSPYVLENGKFPPPNAVHTIEVDGVPIAAVLHKKSKASVAAFEALNNKQFDSAAYLYAQYIQEDVGDDMVWINYGIALASMGKMDDGIEAIKKAIALDEENIQAYQIIAQLYQAKGDMAAAQQAMNTAQAIMQRMQENAPEQ